MTQAKVVVEQALAWCDEAARRASILGVQPGTGEQLITVDAPVPGKVTGVAVAPGEYCSDTAAPELTISDLNTAWVAGDEPEVLIRLIQVGERVTISLPAFPDWSYSGRVTRTGEVVDAETRTIKVRAELSNSGGQLCLEMFVQIKHDYGMRRLPAVLRQEGRKRGECRAGGGAVRGGAGNARLAGE